MSPHANSSSFLTCSTVKVLSLPLLQVRVFDRSLQSCTREATLTTSQSQHIETKSYTDKKTSQESWSCVLRIQCKPVTYFLIQWQRLIPILPAPRYEANHRICPVMQSPCTFPSKHVIKSLMKTSCHCTTVSNEVTPNVKSQRKIKMIPAHFLIAATR